MSRALTPKERDTVRAVLAFLEGLLRCFEQLKDHGTNPDRIRELRDMFTDLSQMLDQGRIDAESADAAEKARTDGNGIHLNVDSTFSLPGDLLLGDCSEGYFSSLWTLIEVLMHEYAHYRRDTGLVGRVLRRIPDTFFGGLALMLGSLTGRTMRTWRWHEMRAYHFGYTMLRTLRHFVFMLDVTDAECLPCPKQHLIYSDEACRRQDPHSTYGN